MTSRGLPYGAAPLHGTSGFRLGQAPASACLELGGGSIRIALAELHKAGFAPANRVRLVTTLRAVSVPRSRIAAFFRSHCCIQAPALPVALPE